jgi:uncharacterized protein (DUF3084 family)
MRTHHARRRTRTHASTHRKCPRTSPVWLVSVRASWQRAAAAAGSEVDDSLPGARERDVTERDQDVTERDQDVTGREQDVTERDQDVTERDQDVTERDQDVTERDHVTEREQDVTERDQDVTERDQDVTERDQDLTEREHVTDTAEPYTLNGNESLPSESSTHVKARVTARFVRVNPSKFICTSFGWTVSVSSC